MVGDSARCSADKSHLVRPTVRAKNSFLSLAEQFFLLLSLISGLTLVGVSSGAERKPPQTSAAVIILKSDWTAF